VDAQAQLDLVLAEREARPTGGRDGAGDRATPIVPTNQAAARASAATSARFRPASAAAPATLWTKDRPGQPAPTRIRGRGGQHHVVGHDHHLDAEPLGPRHLGGQPEVQAIARVVLDD
jgi:hypothetical protein